MTRLSITDVQGGCEKKTERLEKEGERERDREREMGVGGLELLLVRHLHDEGTNELKIGENEVE